MHLIIDGNNYAYRALHKKYEHVVNVEGQEIGIIQSFIMRLRGLLSNTEDITDITICWDSGGTNVRKTILETYKENRKDDDNKKLLYEQISILKEKMPLFGIKQLYYENIEADDIIFVLTKILNHFNQECTVVSADKDLLQLINPLCRVLNLNKKKTIKISNFQEIVGVPLTGHVDYLSLMGDAADDIDGIKDVGPETASKIINMYGSCENLFAKEAEIRAVISLEQIDTGFSKRLLKVFEPQNKEKIKRNRSLIELGNLLTLEEKRQIVGDYEKQKNIHVDYNGIIDFFNKFHIFDTNQNVGVFLMPFIKIREKSQCHMAV